jgi:hypothetical protein
MKLLRLSPPEPDFASKRPGAQELPRRAALCCSSEAKWRAAVGEQLSGRCMRKEKTKKKKKETDLKNCNSSP